jgi:alginate export protein
VIRALRTPLPARAWLCACVLSVPLSGYAQQAGSPSSAALSSAPAQSAAPAAQIVSSAPKPPLPNRLNSVLPSWLRTRGEFRERMEGFDGANFNSTRDDLYWLTRFRFGATVTASKSLSFQAQVHDARVGKKTVGATGSPFRAPFDLRMGFADIGSSTSRVAVRAGRQELVYGDQRLVGHLGWTNAARSFDAVKVTMRGKAASLDVFGASVVRTIEDGFDKSGAGNRFAGSYLTMPKLVKGGSLEPYFFWRRDTNLPGETGVVGDLESSTTGVRFAGKLPLALDYNIEMAFQRGSLGSDDIEAWAGHWQLRESLSGPGSMKLIGEFNYASGDENPTDGIRGTFDQLYPTGHDKYGLADQIGWKNIQHGRAGFEFTPFKATPITTSYHSWWLAEKRDGIYTAGGAPLARVIGGAASAHVGEEIDVQVSRALTPQMQVSGGYAHIFPGAFLEQATPGASYSYPYVQVTYVFLAER